MEDNVLQDIENALDNLSELLDRNEVKTALDAIPDSILDPVVDGLKSILDVIKEALNELKENLDSVVNLDELFTTISSLLEAAEGLAPGQKETLDTVGNIVKTLQDLPGLEDINRILGKIDQIVAKLEAL
jgi:ABC-type transporter Mla subunit MlaD